MTLPHRGASFLFFAEVVDVFLQLFHKKADVVSVADGMVCLNGKGEKALAVLLKVLSHCENGKKELSFVIDVDVERRECGPRCHRDIEGVGRSPLLGSVARGLGVFARIGIVGPEKLGILLGEI